MRMTPLARNLTRTERPDESSPLRGKLTEHGLEDMLMMMRIDDKTEHCDGFGWGIMTALSLFLWYGTSPRFSCG